MTAVPQTDIEASEGALTVALGARAYDILVAPNLIDRAGALIRARIDCPRAVIVTDENVARLHLKRLQTALTAAGIDNEAVTLAPGEATKCFAVLEKLLDTLLERGVERSTPLIALGGGVIGDIAGFAAAVLRRGVDFIQVPTTLLAQVDSSVGGKTGINTRQGKNLVGAFHQPRLVLADTSALDTLSAREVMAGYAEVVKYGVIGDADFFAWLDDHGPALLAGDAAARIHAVTESCRAKARIVAEDETEHGRRALLNMGHTFGHALEAELGYDGRLLHGEGVAIGMVMALELSARLGHAPAGDVARLKAHLDKAGLPHDLSGPGRSPAGVRWDAERLLAHMAQDKKVVRGTIRFILAHRIGNAFIADDVPMAEVRRLLDDFVAGRV